MKYPHALQLFSPIDRQRIVQRYLDNITDKTRLLICKLYSLGKTDREVQSALHLSPAELERQKSVIAQGILDTMNHSHD
nr:MAG TPA: RNA polymerase sigma factor [Caudoviricetes sp.]